MSDVKFRDQPGFAKYAKIISVYASIVIIIGLIVGAVLLSIVVYPPVKEYESFDYQTFRDPRLSIVLPSGQRLVFERTTEEEFTANKRYYYNIAKNSQKEISKEKTMLAGLFILLHVVLYFFHKHLWRQNKL